MNSHFYATKIQNARKVYILIRIIVFPDIQKLFLKKNQEKKTNKMYAWRVYFLIYSIFKGVNTFFKYLTKENFPVLL